MKKLIFLYIFLLSWTDVGSIGDRVPLYFIVGFIIAIILIFQLFILRKQLHSYSLPREDVLLLIFYFYILVNSLLQFNDKTINYLLTYSIIIFIFYFSLLLSIRVYRIDYTVLLYYCYLSTVALMIVIVAEFFLKIGVGINIQNYLPRRREATATFLTFPRSYAFATEPGIIGYYLNTIGILGLAHARKKGRLSSYIILFFLSQIMIYSATSILAIMVGSFSVIVFNLRAVKYVIKKRLLGFIILSVSSVATIRYVLSKGLLAPLILKLTLSTSSSSATDRVQRWSTASELVSINPLFGTGLGNLSSKGYASPVNWFMFISVEAGIIALFLFISFVFVKWLKLSYSRRNLDKYILFGLSASMVHLFATSGFHYPYILLLLVINRLNHFRDESIIPSK